MEKANNVTNGSMAAVLNASIEDIESIISSTAGVLVVANYNTEKQIVISGEDDEILKSIDSLKSISPRIRCIKLNVSGAFHSPLMKFAREALSNAINSLNFNDAKVPIYQNINAKPFQNADDIKKNLILQLENPVQWYNTILNMSAINNNFIECGPGNILSGMNRRISRDIISFEANSITSIESICNIN